jgi:translation initiation factor 3 subunit C
LAQGNWKTCYDLISQLKIWDLLAVTEEVEAIKLRLKSSVQETGLRNFLLNYSPFYHTLSISSLTEMFGLFGLPAEHVRNLLAGMILSGEIDARFDILDEMVTFSEGMEDVRKLAVEVVEWAVAVADTNRKGYKKDPVLIH